MSARIAPLEQDDLSPIEEKDWQELVDQGHLTNMQKTIIRDHATYVAYAAWHDSWRRLVEIVGLRAATVYAHAVSEVNDCQLCSLYFVADLRKLGIEPSSFTATPQEEVLTAFGRQFVQDATVISDELFARLHQFWNDDEIVAIVGFAGQMVATNDFNSAIGVELDERLLPLRSDFNRPTWRQRRAEPSDSRIHLDA